jgi:hypothetical protein
MISTEEPATGPVTTETGTEKNITTETQANKEMAENTNDPETEGSSAKHRSRRGGFDTRAARALAKDGLPEYLPELSDSSEGYRVERDLEDEFNELQ